MKKKYYSSFTLLLLLSLSWSAIAMETINFKTLTLPTRPNYYLVCPENFCAAKANEPSKRYPISRDKLIKAWQKMIMQQSRVTLQYSNSEQQQYGYVQRSALLRFPDFITVQFIAIDETHSTLAVFSRSKYGYYDFGVNEKRVKHWLANLEIS